MPELFRDLGRFPSKEAIDTFYKEVQELSLSKAKEIVKSEVPETLFKEALAEIRTRIRKRKLRGISVQMNEGRRLITAKQTAATGRLAPLRYSGPGNQLFLADLPKELLEELAIKLEAGLD